VAILVFDELKVNVVVTGVLAEFTADTFRPVTSPATMETAAGNTRTADTVVFADFDPPQPVVHDINRTIRAIAVKSGQRGLFPCILRNT
jgi:hypothetical protein